MPDALDILKAKRDGAEAECNALQPQAQRSQQFLNEISTKLHNAQIRYAAYNDLIKELEPIPAPTDAAASTTETPNAS